MSKTIKEPVISSIHNGLRVASVSMPDVETVSVGVWVNVGSRYESEALNGISHFLEHMAFKGTERRTAKQIAVEFDHIGGMLNAYTSRERTVYYAVVLKEDLPLAMDILADIMQYSTFDAAELERERGVILQEIAQTHDTPDDIIFDYFQEKAFPNQSLGRPILGSQENVSRFQEDDLRNYMGQYYCAEHMAVVVAGNATHEEVLDLAQSKFTQIPAKQVYKPKSPIYEGGAAYVQRELEQVHIVMGLKGVAYTDVQAFYTQQLSMNILGGGMSSRLFQEVREKRGLAYTISAYGSGYCDSGIVGVYAGTSEKQANELIEVVCDEWHKATHTITEEELQGSKNQVRAGLLMSRDSSRARMEELGSNILVYNRHISIEEILEKINAITVDMVQKSLAHSLHASTLSFAAIGNVDKVMEYEVLKKKIGI